MSNAVAVGIELDNNIANIAQQVKTQWDQIDAKIRQVNITFQQHSTIAQGYVNSTRLKVPNCSGKSPSSSITL